MRICQDYAEIPYRVREIRFEVDQFTVVGDFLMPREGVQHPVINFVWGSGEGGRHLVGKPSRLITTFMQSGYAVFIADKPGSGASTGCFSKERLLHERARILVKAIETLRQQLQVLPHQVGLYGGSQAGYVIALAMDMGVDIDFLVAVSCPAMDSVRQSAYLVRRQLLCEGYTIDEANMAEKYYIQRGCAQDYPTYLEAASFLNHNPIVRDDLAWGEIVEQHQFVPHADDWEELYNPMDGLQGLMIPVLAMFGERDTQVDPVQGAKAYQALLEKGGNPFSQVALLPKTDHNMRITKTGCLKEQRVGYRKAGGAEYNPEFLKILEEWLQKLQQGRA